MKIEMPQFPGNDVEKQIAEVGGMTEEKARDLELAQKHIEREEHLDLAKKIINTSKEEMDAMSPTEKAIFIRTGLDINNEEDREKYSEISRITKLDAIKQEEANVILFGDKKQQEIYNKMVDDYNKMYGEKGWYKMQLDPRNKLAAEEFLMSLSGAPTKKTQEMGVAYKKDPNKVFEEELQLEDAA